jgi:colanic acid/amylovoran biosynthesis glycosyltransferase
MYHPLFAVGDAYVASSPYLRDLAIGHGCPPDKIRVHPVEIDTGWFCPPDVLLPESPDKTILSVGRLVWEKDYNTALEAVAILKAAEPAWNLTYRIYGEGPLESELKAKVTQLGLSETVILEGAVDRTRLKQAYQSADVFLMPSVSEGLGSAALEAQACGLTVAATEVGGLPWAVRHQKTGLLSPAQNPQAIAASLRQILSNPALRQQMGEAARRHVEAEFSGKGIDNMTYPDAFSNLRSRIHSGMIQFYSLGHSHTYPETPSDTWRG